MKTTNNTNTAKATARISYVLAGKRANQATAKATAAAAKLNAIAAAAKATAAADATAHNTAKATVTAKAAHKLMVAVANANTANTAAAAKIAAAKAADAAVYASAIDAADAADAAAELAHNMRTVYGVFAYVDATLADWVARRTDATAATFERHATAKSASYRLVITRPNGRKVYMSVNTTAALDWRKIDANYSKRLAKLAAKDAK